MVEGRLLGPGVVAGQALTPAAALEQVDQLCALYNSTGGAGWANSTGWSSSCSTSGVTPAPANPCNRTAVPFWTQIFHPIFGLGPPGPIQNQEWPGGLGEFPGHCHM